MSRYLPYRVHQTGGGQLRPQLHRDHLPDHPRHRHRQVPVLLRPLDQGHPEVSSQEHSLLGSRTLVMERIYAMTQLLHNQPSSKLKD